MTEERTSLIPRSGRRNRASVEGKDPPIRLSHVLFVLWVAGSVAWAFYAAKAAHHQGWWDSIPHLAAVLVLTPPILAHLLANFVIKITGNPRFRS
jgi:hypothetical protein